MEVIAVVTGETKDIEEECLMLLVNKAEIKK
jgi:hypothetical protein